MEIGKCKGCLVRVIGINRIAAEEEIAKENEVIELSGFGTIKGIRFLGLSFLDRGIGIVQSYGSCGEGSESCRASRQWNETSKGDWLLSTDIYRENLSNLI